MNEYYASAYLDDYNLISLTLSKRICNGISEKFNLILNQQIIDLDIVEHKDKKDSVDYTLSFKEELVIGQPYEVMMVSGYTVPLTYRKIVKTKRFNEDFYYGGSDLGSNIISGLTSFKLWAPTASEVILVIGEKLFKMVRGDKGVYSLSFRADLTGSSYYYIVTVNGQTYKTVDPYGKASLANSKESVVVSIPDVVNSTSFEETNEIAYELSVRDFSKEATFGSLIDEIDYLKQLGVTAIQLLPVNDFGSVNDYHKSSYYNWGYDPVQYQCLEGSYSSDPSKPLLVIDEFKQLVEAMHENGLKVILDVVFNHHYYAQRSCFNRTVPYYFFRINEKGEFVDGTGCGSECDSTQLMCRKYIIDTLKHYVSKYNVDGFRFDLMNFIDTETMNLALAAVKQIKPKVIFYGEGWKISAGAPLDILAHYDNSEKVPSIGFFNDRFRDIIKGSTFEMANIGYGSGNVWLANEALEVIKGKRFFNKQQSVNYVECHDNATLYDKLKACCKDESEELIKKRVKLINAMNLLAQGVAFMHAGQEHCLSKGGLTNTYNGPEKVNKISLEEREKNKDVIDYVKSIISIKKRFNIGLNDDYDIYQDNGVIIYTVNGATIIINPSINTYSYQLIEPKRVICNEMGECDIVEEDIVEVSPVSMYILESVI